MQLTLGREETTLLREILTVYLSDLRMQISNTDDYELRQQLKEREEAIKSLIGRLSQAAAA